jgi:hypothetical protein
VQSGRNGSVRRRGTVADRDQLVRTYSLPDDTANTYIAALEPLRRFPRLGPELRRALGGFRFILGPWRWMLFVYVFDEARDRVTKVTTNEARTSTAVTGECPEPDASPTAVSRKELCWRTACRGSLRVADQPPDG